MPPYIIKVFDVLVFLFKKEKEMKKNKILYKIRQNIWQRG